MCLRGPCFHPYCPRFISGELWTIATREHLRNSTNTPGDGVEWHVPTSKQSPKGTPKGTPKSSADIGDALDVSTKLDAMLLLIQQDLLARNPPTLPPTPPPTPRLTTKNSKKKKKKEKSRNLLVSQSAANAGDGDGGSTEQSGTSSSSVTAIAAGSMLAGVVLTVASAVIWSKFSGASAPDALPGQVVVVSPDTRTDLMSWDPSGPGDTTNVGSANGGSV